MANKTNLISSINTQLTALITQAKVRLAMNELVSEIYPDIISESDSSTNLITEKNSNPLIKYSVHIVKQGRLVHLSGIITNDTSLDITYDGINYFFKIVHPDFLSKTGITSYNCTTVTGEKVRLSNLNNLQTTKLEAGKNITFNLFYYTKN